MNPSRFELWNNYSQEKSQEIRNKIVESYLDLVKQETKKSKAPVGIDKQDIYQFGVLGLIKAVDKCDIKQIDKFESYASIKIRGEIKDQLRKHAMYSQGVSRTTLKQIKELERVKSKLETEKKEKVSGKDIMDYLNIEEKEFGRIQQKSIIYNGMSIDEFFDNPYEKKDFGEENNAEYQIIEDETKKEVIGFVKKLKEKERYVIENYYFKHKNINEISKDLNITEARVSQIHHEAIKKLRLLLGKE